MKTRYLLPVLAGCAAALIALTVVLFRGSDSSIEEKPNLIEEADAGSDPLAQKTAAADETSIDEQSSSADSNTNSSVEAKEVIFRFSPDKWIQVMRNKIPKDIWYTEETLKRLNEDRSVLEDMTFEERQAYVKSLGIYVWEWNPIYSYRGNMTHMMLFQEFGTLDINAVDQTPHSVIEFLVHGLDDLTAAQHLNDPPDWWLWRTEREYALEYVNRALENDPRSLEALILKRSLTALYADRYPIARQLIEYHPNDPKALEIASITLCENYPEEVVFAIHSYIDQTADPIPDLYDNIGVAYERLGMIAEALEQYQIGAEAGNLRAKGRYMRLLQGKSFIPSIWEERAAAEAAELAETPQSIPPPEGTAPPEPHDGPPPPTPPEEPPQPPMDAERDLADAYAQFAETYRSVFEAEYGPPADTPEGRMSALLGMARAFAKAGDAEQAQAAYNEARKRFTRGQVQEAFRRLDEAERLRRQRQQEQRERDEMREDMREEEDE